MLTERSSQKRKRNNYKSLYESIMMDVSKVIKKHLNETDANKDNEWIDKDEKPKYKFKVAYVQDAEDGMALIQDDEWIYCRSYGGAYWEAVHLGGKMSPIWDYVENTIWAWPDDGSIKDYVDSKQTPPDFYNEFGYDDIGTIILAPIDY